MLCSHFKKKEPKRKPNSATRQIWNEVTITQTFSANQNHTSQSSRDHLRQPLWLRLDSKLLMLFMEVGEWFHLSVMGIACFEEKIVNSKQFTDRKLDLDKLNSYWATAMPSSVSATDLSMIIILHRWTLHCSLHVCGISVLSMLIKH